MKKEWSQETDLCTYGHLIYDEEATAEQWGNNNLFNKLH